MTATEEKRLITDLEKMKASLKPALELSTKERELKVLKDKKKKITDTLKPWFDEKNKITAKYELETGKKMTKETPE